MIISFGKTSGALLAGCKTVTRRDWNPKHAAKFKAGMLVDAWNTSPRNVRGNPHKIATIRLTADPYLEDSRAVCTWDEAAAEGFHWMDENGLRDQVDAIEADWMRNPRDVYVVRFEVVSR